VVEEYGSVFCTACVKIQGRHFEHLVSSSGDRKLETILQKASVLTILVSYIVA
jgi:hypothetical protein